MPVTKQNLDDVFRYHAPTEEDVKKYERMRAAAKHFASEILECATGADQQAAIRLVREALMTANASVATKGAV